MSFTSSPDMRMLTGGHVAELSLVSSQLQLPCCKSLPRYCVLFMSCKHSFLNDRLINRTSTTRRLHMMALSCNWRAFLSVSGTQALRQKLCHQSQQSPWERQASLPAVHAYAPGSPVIVISLCGMRLSILCMPQQCKIAGSRCPRPCTI